MADSSSLSQGNHARFMKLDPYKILDLPWGAPEDAIKRAFRELAYRHHPDRNPGDAAAEERLKLITAAYHRLKESGFRLPRPARHAPNSAPRPAPTPTPPAPEESFELPKFWPDGQPIHYPSAEEIEALLRDVASNPLRRQVRARGERVQYALWRVIGFFLLALPLLFIVALVLIMARDFWAWLSGAP